MKNETLFPHKNFLHKNNIEITKLPQALQKRIYGFEELDQDLLTTLDEDRETLLSRMEDLSHELDEDLEEYFEKQLDNNDEQEDEETQIAVSASPSHPEHECACKHAKNNEQEFMVTLPQEPAQPADPIKEVEPMNEPEPMKDSETLLKSELMNESEQMNEPEKFIEPEPEKAAEPDKKERSDEDLLAGLLESGRNKILPAELYKQGFKTPLNFKVIVIGKFYLRRGKYETHYQILRG